MSYQLHLSMRNSISSESGKIQRNRFTNSTLVLVMAALKGSELIAPVAQVYGYASHVTQTTLCGVLQARKVAAEFSFAIFYFFVVRRN